MTAPYYHRASIADAAVFAALHAKCFESPWDQDGFIRLLARSGAYGLIAFDRAEGCPAGFALFESIADEAEILTFGVSPDCRRRGLAAGLLAHGLANLAECGVALVHLEVAGDNEAALALYRKAGFIESGRRPGYYRRSADSRPVDGLILTGRAAPVSGR